MPPVFEQVTSFYEVLLRFGDQPENRGQLTGAHLQKLTQTLMDGKVIATADDGAKPLALLDSEDGEKLADVLGVVNTQTLMQNQLLTSALTAERANSAELTNNLTGSQARERALATQLEAAQVEIARLQELVAAQVEVTTPQGE